MIGKAEWMTPSLAEADGTTQRRKEKKARRAKKASKAKAAAPLLILLPGRANPRFIVTSLKTEEHEARALYEKRYCARGEAENHIKECQLDLFADRTSSHTMRANQLRMYSSAVAYVLVSGLRRFGLKATDLATAQVTTIRTRLLKIGAQVRVSVRRVALSMAAGYPWGALYAQVYERLRGAAARRVRPG